MQQLIPQGHGIPADLCAVSEWCNLWQMTLNINKCKTIRVSRRNTSSSPYSICNTQLVSVTSFKYLGVHIASNLSWKTHSDHVIANANSMLGYLKRNFSLAPMSLKLFLYKTLIRSKLEYAAAIWDPGHSTFSKTCAIRTILNCMSLRKNLCSLGGISVRFFWDIASSGW